MIHKIIICDDVEEEGKELAALAGEYYKGKAEIALCANGDELEKVLRKENVDVIFLDIEMPGENGIEIKDRLEAAKVESYIVFVTAHMNFMQEAFGKNVVGYIEKPPEKEKFYKVLMRIDNSESQNKTIEVETILGEIKKIQLDHIRYIEADRRYSFVHIEDERILVCKGLNKWEEELKEEYFVRIHKSYLVNLRYVDKIKGRQVYMKNEEDKKKVRDGKNIKKKKGKEVFNLTRDKVQKDKIMSLYMEYIRKTAKEI